MSDTPRTDDEFSDAIKQLDLLAELAEMKKKLAEARGLYLQRNYHREQLERELAAAIKERDEACQRTYNAGFVEASRIHGIEIQQLRQQRDEARELYCRQIAYDLFRTTGVFDPQQVAIKRGWVGLFKANEPAPRDKEGGGA